jgi:hypothetical protein
MAKHPVVHSNYISPTNSNIVHAPLFEGSQFQTTAIVLIKYLTLIWQYKTTDNNNEVAHENAQRH